MAVKNKAISALNVHFGGFRLESVLAVADKDIAAVASAPGCRKVSIDKRNFLGSVGKILEGLKHPAALPSLLILPLTGCGGSGTTATTSDSGDGGIVFDGYLVGATVYREGSDSSTGVTTETGGVFSSLTGSGDFIVVGGTDASTGLAFTGQLKAPDGYGVVSPLTTMVEALIASGTDATTALANVTSSLGLTGVDLSTLDPIATGNTDVFKAGVQVSSMLATASSGSATDYASFASSLASALNAKAVAGGSFDISDATSMSSLADDFSTQVTAAGDATLIASLATQLATIKTTVASVAAATDISSIASAQSTALAAFADQGTALKGPLHQAIVFNDYNGDGELTYGESWTTTAEDGSYALTKESNILGLVGKVRDSSDSSFDFDDTGWDYDDYSIVVSMGEDTIDYSSGESYADAGVSLKAAPGGGVITPMTTLHEHSEEHADSFQVAELAAALGIDSSVDILNFNTHADGVDEALAHEVETIQQHLMTTTMMVQAAIKGSGTPADGTAVSTAVAHDAALDSLIKLIIEVHGANNGGSDEVAITGDLDLSDHEHLEELEELIEADLADTSDGGFGKTMDDNGTSVPSPVLEYVLEHASHVINLINTKLDALGSDDFGSIEAGAISHLKHDIADQIEAMATAARAHYDAWVLANPDGTFDSGVVGETGELVSGSEGDWAGFDPYSDGLLTLNSVSALDAQIALNKVIVSDHLIETGQAVAVLVKSDDSKVAYDSFEDAYAAAVDGDTIELGAGEHALTDGSLKIEKELTIKGANAGVTFDRDQITDSTATATYDSDTTDHEGYGYIDPDELVLPEDGVARTGGAEETYINGTLTIAADNVTLDGLQLQNSSGSLLFDSTSEPVIDNFAVKNSYIIGYAGSYAPTLGGGNYVGDDLGTNWLIQGNIIGGVVSGTGGSMYLSGITNTETDSTGDLGLIGNMFWRPAAGHVYLSSLTNFAIENNNFYHGLHADGADLDGLLSEYFTSTSGYSSATPYGYGYGADGQKTVAYGADGEVLYYIDAYGRPRELSAEDGYGAIYTTDAYGAVLIPYGYGGTSTPDGFIELDAAAGDTAAITESSSSNFYGRNYWFELKGVNDGIKISGNTGSYNSGGIQFYGEESGVNAAGETVAYQFDNITISNNLFTEMYNGDPNGLMQTVYQNGKSGLLGPITISLNDTYGASAENISITGNIIDIPVNQIYGSYDYVSGVQVRGDVDGLIITSNTISFTNTVDADGDLAQVKATDTESAYNSVVEGIKVIGGISGAIDVSGNTFNSDLTASQASGDDKVELRVITIDGAETNYGAVDGTNVEVTALDASGQTIDADIAQTSLANDIGLTISSLPGIDSENFSVTDDDFEVALLSALSLADVQEYFTTLASSNIGVATEISGVDSSSTINVADMLSGLGYSSISETTSVAANKLIYQSDSSLGGVYQASVGASALDVPSQIEDDLGDNQLRADARLVDTTGDDSGDSTLVTLLYDSDSAVGSIEYSYRQLYITGDHTSVALDDSDAFDYDFLVLNAAPAITSTAVESASEDSAYTYAITATDAEGTNVTITTVVTDSNGDEASWLSFANNTLTGTPDNEDVGAYTVVVTATDADNQSSTQSFTLTVANTNDAPVITLPSDLATSGSQGSQYTAQFTVSDDDSIHGDTTTTSVTVDGTDIGSVAWIDVTESSGTFTLTGTPTITEAGQSYEVVITSTDGDATDSESFDIAVSGPTEYLAFDLVSGSLKVYADIDAIEQSVPDAITNPYLYAVSIELGDQDGSAFDSVVLHGSANGNDFDDFDEILDTIYVENIDTTPSIPLSKITMTDTSTTGAKTLSDLGNLADADGLVLLGTLRLADSSLSTLDVQFSGQISVADAAKDAPTVEVIQQLEVNLDIV